MTHGVTIDGESEVVYEKCQHCHLFIHENPAYGDAPDLVRWDHGSRGDDADEAIEATHDATPSGLIATLETWKAFGPLEMRKRFDDYTPEPLDGMIEPRDAEEGATYTPWTDGWAVGFKVTAEGKPDRYLHLNPSQTDDLGESNAFVYLDDDYMADPSRVPVKPVCYVTIWDD